jgi:AraC-like DNA-binding protein
MEAKRIPWNSFAAVVRDQQPGREKAPAHTLLVVEESPVVYLQFKHSALTQFPVSFSCSRSAVSLACEEQPKLIVLHTDHDCALELNRQLKAHPQTDDIPVIQLSQELDETKRREAFRAGVDEYWATPVTIDDLIVRAHNLIQVRQALKAKFCSPSPFPRSREEKFLRDATDAILRCMSDPDFNVTALAREVGVSVTQLYRKCMVLTGRSPNDLIRHHRLERATDLLRTHSGNVSEVAYWVGFSNLSYFTKCFKGQFHCLPSLYAKQGPW